MGSLNLNNQAYDIASFFRWFLRVTNIHRVFMYVYMITPILVLSVMFYKHKETIGLGDLLVMSIFFIPAFIHYLAIIGLRNGRVWGRILSIVIAVLILFLFPIGTIAGVFMLMQLFKKDWKAKV